MYFIEPAGDAFLICITSYGFGCLYQFKRAMATSGFRQQIFRKQPLGCRTRLKRVPGILCNRTMRNSVLTHEEHVFLFFPSAFLAHPLPPLSLVSESLGTLHGLEPDKPPHGGARYSLPSSV